MRKLTLALVLILGALLIVAADTLPGKLPQTLNLFGDSASEYISVGHNGTSAFITPSAGALTVNGDGIVVDYLENPARTSSLNLETGVMSGVSVTPDLNTSALSESTDDTFAQYDADAGLSEGLQAGGVIVYSVTAYSATAGGLRQTRSGSVPFAISNHGGSIVCGVGTQSEAVAVSSGTFTVTFTCSVTSNTVNLRANAASSGTADWIELAYEPKLSSGDSGRLTHVP